MEFTNHMKIVIGIHKVLKNDFSSNPKVPKIDPKGV